MHERRKLLLQRLQEDEALLNMLASNKAFWNQNLESEKRYSIIPADKIYKNIKTPFLTVQVTNEVLVGDKLSDVFVSIRCYNGSDKTFVNIDAVLSRVKELLHNKRFTSYDDNTVSINTIYESTGAELSDQAYDLNFRESQYRIQYL